MTTINIMGKMTRVILLALLIFLTTIIIGAHAEIYPSNPTAVFDLGSDTVTYGSNVTNAYPNGTGLNGTRGYIYNITINESQPTYKWIGYVGNVQGTFALQDASANALYSWDIANITGELYATKEGPHTTGNILEENNGGGTVNPFNGGIPVWDSLICANSSMITTETERFNHSDSAEDRYNNTFMTAGFTVAEFYAGQTLINNSVSGSGTDCFGTYLRNNSAKADAWRETVLTDETYQNKSTTEDTVKIYDIIYVAQFSNETEGFDGNLYDFQIMLPQSGLEGGSEISNIAYYFYIELI